MCPGSILGRTVALSAEQIGLADVEMAGLTRPITSECQTPKHSAPGDWALILVGVAMED